MKGSRGMNYGSKMLEYMRAGARVNSRVKVELEWEEKGVAHKSEGFTLDVSPKGCMAIAQRGPGLGERLRLKNGHTQKETAATLIWRGHEGRTGWELGLELVDPPADFWGMEF
jgi:hypothetical protein